MVRATPTLRGVGQRPLALSLGWVAERRTLRASSSSATDADTIRWPLTISSSDCASCDVRCSKSSAREERRSLLRERRGICGESDLSAKPELRNGAENLRFQFHPGEVLCEEGL